MIKRAERIDEIQLGGESPAGDLPPPKPRADGGGHDDP